MRSIYSCVLLAASLAACAGDPVPAKSAADVKADIRAAEAIGAQTLPLPSLHLKLARDQAAQADRLIQDGDNEEARLALERAKIDVELAILLTREAELRARADAASQRAKAASR
jgi:hypothetical protein